MRKELLEAMARVITVHCYWLRVADITEHHTYCIIRDEHLEPVDCRCLTLEVKHSHGHHYVGHRWQIAEYELDRVVDAMRNNSPSFRQRCKELTLTKQDVETIILLASYGIVKLEMSDDDFNPQISKQQIH